MKNNKGKAKTVLITKNMTGRIVGHTKIDAKTIRVTWNDVANWDIEKDNNVPAYLKAKLVLSMLAYPLTENHKLVKRDGKSVIQFPVEIELPDDLTISDIKGALCGLASF